MLKSYYVVAEFEHDDTTRTSLKSHAYDNCEDPPLVSGFFKDVMIIYNKLVELEKKETEDGE